MKLWGKIKMIFNYQKPYMVKFKENDQAAYEPLRYGIVYYNEVICLECGNVIPCGNISELIIVPWSIDPASIVED
jgi:hypothetical protein